ncbi:MAG: dihydroorotase family protein [Chloroflexi bacterium]|nr:dihydroorotase family protein [Chloroflexota bacterium]
MQLTLLKGGQLVVEGQLLTADLAIVNERILGYGADLAPPPEFNQFDTVDVSGLTILPGLVDVHVHLREPGAEHKEDFLSGTRAALAGCVTTVFGMPNTTPTITTRTSLDQAIVLADEKAVCDFGLYVGGTQDNADEAASLSDAVGLKLYIGSSTGDLLVDQFEAQIAHFMATPLDRIIAVHAEDEAAVRHYAKQGQRRPPICAKLSTAYLLTLAEQTGRHLHICHVTTRDELTLIRQAKERGVRVTCEVSPHHLWLNTQDEQRLGPYGRCNPPLRDEPDRTGLWEHLDGVDLIATDHAPHTRAEKESGTPPAGIPGLETMLPLLLTAVTEGRMSLADVVSFTATRPAHLFNLPDKGSIRPNKHADLTLVDLNETWTLSDDGLETRCGWTPFAGMDVTGRVKQVWLRGQCVYREGSVVAEPGYGQRVQQGQAG